jgi:nicotinamidase-related amidase
MPNTSLDPSHTALVAIDLQNGVTALPVSPHASSDVVARTSAMATALREKGGLVVWVNVAAPVGPAALAPKLDNPPKFPPTFPAEWTVLVSSLDVQPGDLRVLKRNWGAFYGTDLDLQLRRRGIDTIVLSGIATNLGVESTARDAYERGYHQIFAEDAMSGLGEGAHQAAVGTIFPRIGRVRSSNDVLAALR